MTTICDQVVVEDVTAANDVVGVSDSVADALDWSE